MMIKNRAELCLAQGTGTNSKHWRTHIDGVFPTHCQSSEGPWIIATDKRKYLDFICGLGTNLYGYGNPRIEQKVAEYQYQGKSPSLPHVLEVETAEKLKAVFPWVQRWKFLKSGSEACTAAVRIARAYTQKKVIVSEGYHGWHDLFTSLTPPRVGVYDSFNVVYDQRDAIASVAAHIVEPVELDESDARRNHLQQLRDNCTRDKSLLIFDEVITGFRYHKGSVAASMNIKPDLIVIGKAMANGYPLAAVGGSAEIMDGDYFVSSTYSGEIGSIAACSAAVDLYKNNDKYNIDRLWEEGNKFRTTFNDHAADLGFQIEGYATRGYFKGDAKEIAIFRQEACRAGMLFGPSWFISFSHIAYLEDALKSCLDILTRMRTENIYLLGHMPSSPFSAKARR